MHSSRVSSQSRDQLRISYISALTAWFFTTTATWEAQYRKYIMQSARLDEAQDGIKISGRNFNNLRYADDTILMAETEEELKSLLMKVKEESKKAGLKLIIQKTKIMTSGPSLYGK